MTTTPREKNRLISGYHRAISYITMMAQEVMSPEDYEELVSDCMMSASQAMDTLVWRYIRGAMSNSYRTAISQAHKMERRNLSIQTFTDAEAVPDTPAPDIADEAEYVVWRDSVLASIKNPRQRMVLENTLDGLTFAETGRRLGVSREAVRQLHNRGVLVARRAMGMDGEDGTNSSI
jgi:RNA polymerase sigma factor (sigma-70 family)